MIDDERNEKIANYEVKKRVAILNYVDIVIDNKGSKKYKLKL